MQINLEDLAAKRAKSSLGLSISDHTFDLANFQEKELVITGKGTRGLVFKNAKYKTILFQDCVIDNAGTGVVIKIDGATEYLNLIGSNCKLYGRAGNSQSQMIYVVGTWSNVRIGGFEIDQRRDNKTGSTVTGACVQLQGCKTGNLGTVDIFDLTIRNAGDEGVYVNHFERDTVYVEGKSLTLENIKVFGSGRDFLQEWGFDNVVIKNCYGENGMKEADVNHMSACSINGDTESLLIEDCEFKNIAQLLYSGKPSSGKSINALIKNVNYDQGVHAGSRSNSSVYAKGPGVYRFENCEILAPAVKIAAFSADGCKIEVSKNCVVIAPNLFRDPFNGGSYDQITPEPIVTKTVGEITIQTATTWDGKVTTQYFIGDRELIIK